MSRLLVPSAHPGPVASLADSDGWNTESGGSLEDWHARPNGPGGPGRPQAYRSEDFKFRAAPLPVPGPCAGVTMTVTVTACG
eukprot:71783-Rhodomonas_salina.1